MRINNGWRGSTRDERELASTASGGAAGGDEEGVSCQPDNGGPGCSHSKECEKGISARLASIRSVTTRGNLQYRCSELKRVKIEPRTIRHSIRQAVRRVRTYSTGTLLVLAIL